jgi:hypothetical protein
MAGGRPTDYNEKIANDICEMIANGMSVNSICKRDDMPVYSTVTLWRRKYPEFSANYDKAKQDCADLYAEEIIEIADNVTNDVALDVDGKPYIDGFAAQRAKIMIDSRKWVASKLKPKSWGDKQEIDHTSSDGSMSLASLVSGKHDK